MTPTSHEVTALLVAWSEGDQGALDRLVPLVYAELHRLAKSYMRRERAGHSLQTTALIHEAYVRLIDAQQIQWQNRAHFFGVAARIMRQILVAKLIRQLSLLRREKLAVVQTGQRQRHESFTQRFFCTKGWGAVQNARN